MRHKQHPPTHVRKKQHANYLENSAPNQSQLLIDNQGRRPFLKQLKLRRKIQTTTAMKMEKKKTIANTQTSKTETKTKQT